MCCNVGAAYRIIEKHMDFLWRGQAIYMVECLRISDMLSKHITVIWPVLQPASQSDPSNKMQ